MKKLMILALALALAACEDAPSTYHPAPLTFNGGPMMVNVAKITITDHYQSPMRRPNVEQEFPVSPDNAVKQWVNSRLKANGSSGTLDVEIHEASATEAKLPVTQGVKGLFTDDQDRRYDTKISVTYRLYEDGGNAARATGDVVVTRSKTLNERATMDDRTALYANLTNALMGDFDRESVSRLRQYFGSYLR